MHYKDGTKAELGDLIKFPDGPDWPDRYGTLIHVDPTNVGSCNGLTTGLSMSPAETRGNLGYPEYVQLIKSDGIAWVIHTWQRYVTLNDCELIFREKK